MNINNKGFTLVEMLAVVVILGILATIMVPTVTTVIKKNKSDNYENLKKSVISAVKMYISDNRYDITLDNQVCGGDVKYREIQKIGEETISESRIKIDKLVINNYLTDGEMLGSNGNRINKNESYIVVKYNCSKKDYEYKELKLVE